MILLTNTSKANDFEERCFNWEDTNKISRFLIEKDECEKNLNSCNLAIEKITRPSTDHSETVFAAFVTFVLAGLIGFQIGRGEH